MKLEAKIYQLIWETPSLFHDRTDALQHLFLDLNSFYRWEKGEIHGPEDKQKLSRLDEIPILERMLAESEKGHVFDLEGLKKLNAEWLARAQAKILPIRQNIEDLVLTTHPCDNLCVLSDLANLWQIPDNVKNDWLGGAQEAVELILYATRTVQEKNSELLPPAELHTIRARNFAMAKRAQQRINLLNQR
jgi:hypothetical protein